MKILHQSSHESGYSDYCSTTTTFLFEELNNLSVTHMRYDGYYHNKDAKWETFNFSGGTPEEKEMAKAKIVEWLGR